MKFCHILVETHFVFFPVSVSALFFSTSILTYFGQGRCFLCLFSPSIPPLSPLILRVRRCSLCVVVVVVGGGSQAGNHRPPAAAPPIWLLSSRLPPPPSPLYTPRPIRQCGNNNSQAKLSGLPLLSLILLPGSVARSPFPSVLGRLESFTLLLSLTSLTRGVCARVSVRAL